MCGIAGMYNSHPSFPFDRSVLGAMTGVLEHRGPDEEGFFVGENVALGQRRLSIVDLSGGTQPVRNEDGSVWVVFNGEIYNHPQLMESLRGKGHQFRSRCDTEVLVHLYEEMGEEFVRRLNGQFALAIWDNRKKRLILARDRVGIRPLYYSSLSDGTVLFGSEVKSLFCHPDQKREIDPVGLEQILTIWVTVPPRTVFSGVQELPPGCIASVDRSGVRVSRYWGYSFPDEGDYSYLSKEWYIEELQQLLYDSVSIRLKADVPVGAYLSGGLDSSIITALINRESPEKLRSFSVSFRDRLYDERPYQELMSKRLNTEHQTTEIGYEQIGDLFPQVVWHAETPQIRTAPCPMFALASLVKQSGLKVVLTGEGADEVFGGYNIFKENRIRRFWGRNPHSRIRPHLLKRIYPYIHTANRNDAFWQGFFKRGLTDISSPFYSHTLRWANTGRIKRFLNSELQLQLNEKEHVFDELNSYLDSDMLRWNPLCQAQYLEMMLFMPGYLLSSQGDRMLMGNSVEGRFPFLDHRVIEFANSIPPDFKLNILEEKYILKQAFSDILPKEIASRPKQPYRAPISRSFLPLRENLSSLMLTREKLDSVSLFDSKAVSNLLKKIESHSDGGEVSATDDMAVALVASTQLLHRLFIQGSDFRSQLSERNKPLILHKAQNHASDLSVS
ncbi:Asparagine synthetase [glutamine-hydrolyzing] [Chitinispirillum alkaliphilum]|nr:Asparagine synthetase [glutamine-hydrolyzing] [Chitinispirillum alkaliphilum]